MILRRILLIFTLLTAMAGCDTLDNRRLPVANVHLTFYTQADWVTYGVSGARQYRIFIREKRQPANYPYTADSYTGFGGILLCTTDIGDYVAYDLACPVECRADTRVAVGSDGIAECPKCHSRYDIFSLPGHPVGGEAADRGYGLQTYRVSPGSGGEYMVVY